MKAIDPGDLAPRDVYRLLVSAVVPRPIALVSTLSEAGIASVAPFSFFSGVASRPPLVSVAIGLVTPAERDAMRNIRATREFVVNVVDRALARAAARAGEELAQGVDRFHAAGLAQLPSNKVAAPRVAESPVHFECAAVDLIERPGGAAATLVLGRVLRFHVARHLLRDGEIDPRALDPVGRLGGDLHATLADPFELPGGER